MLGPDTCVHSKRSWDLPVSHSENVISAAILSSWSRVIATSAGLKVSCGAGWLALNTRCSFSSDSAPNMSTAVTLISYSKSRRANSGVPDASAKSPDESARNVSSSVRRSSSSTPFTSLQLRQRHLKTGGRGVSDRAETLSSEHWSM